MTNEIPLSLSNSGAAGLIDGIADALGQGKTSASEICEQSIAAIERADATLNAVPLALRDFDRAREQAQAVDARRLRGVRQPLDGVPFLVKESFNVAGLPTSWGIAAAREYRCQADAAIVQRLKRAGAILLGKTNVATALSDWQCENPVYGRTLHPESAAHTPGGSSGGAAVAVAANYSPLTIGSDFADSIRVPAHFCGTFGHKPSHGLLPVAGHAFPGQVASEPDPFTVVGPMANSAQDLRVALDVLTQPLSSATPSWTIALPPPRRTKLRGCRVLVLDRHPACATSAQVRAAVVSAADAMADAGAHVVNQHDDLPDLNACAELHQGMHLALLSRLLAAGGPAPVSVADWLRLLDQRAAIRGLWQTLFQHIDVVLSPPFGTTAFVHQTEPDVLKRTLQIDGRATPYVDQIAWPGIATLAGLPATVFPWRRPADDALPLGLQVIGPFLEDRTPIEVAGLVAALR